MLNIAKWVYFFLLIQTHRDIRIFEINEAIYPNRRDSKLRDSKLRLSIVANSTENSSMVDKKLISENNEKIEDIKSLHLKKLKFKSDIINTTVAVLGMILSSIYFYVAIKYTSDCFASEDDCNVYVTEIK